MGDMSFCLLPDFVGCAMVVSLPVGVVGILVGIKIFVRLTSVAVASRGLLPFRPGRRGPRRHATRGAPVPARAGIEESGTSVRPVESGGIVVRVKRVTIVMYSGIE